MEVHSAQTHPLPGAAFVNNVGSECLEDNVNCVCVAGDLRLSPVEIMCQRFIELRLPSDVRDARPWALCTCASESIILVI